MAYHETRLTKGPTEGLNNLIKRLKRVTFGFSNFENYRIRALLYSGKPKLEGTGFHRGEIDRWRDSAVKYNWQ